MERIIFKRNADGSLTAPDTVKQEVAARFKANRGTLDREIIDCAAADLVKAVKQEMYSTGKSYDEISRHLVTTNGWFGLSVAAFAEDGERSKRDLGVEIASA